RSRLVFWPGAASGTGAPTDRPERIATAFVALGAPMIHLVDLDGAKQGVPVNTAAIAAVARDVGVPLQVAGGVDGPRQIELAFAAGATRVVVPVWIAAESLEGLRECVRAAGDWLSVGLDAREERLREYPWPGNAPTLDELAGTLAGEGVRRLVVSHWTLGDLPRLAAIKASHDISVQLAGGISEPAQIEAATAAGIDTLILGEALLSGAIDYQSVVHEKVMLNG
ncbi:MAG: phosphoribosylformimino-5-aminoimidazole carboxamide ribotide isomerase, partial [Chloroflexota bacterium]|nr:phosphoribosylformimino-5-aminoimidazole carboxamide ribotide isomerase [Chloroflexota bacterium]